MQKKTNKNQKTLVDIFDFSPQVYNIKTDNIPPNAVNIMRPSKWGNPFRLVDYNNNREVVLQLYEQYILSKLKDPDFINELAELKGKDLVCCCHPKKCHGHVLLKIANSLP